MRWGSKILAVSGICMIGRRGFLCFAVVVCITNFHLFGRIVWWEENGELRIASKYEYYTTHVLSHAPYPIQSVFVPMQIQPSCSHGPLHLPTTLIKQPPKLPSHPCLPALPPNPLHFLSRLKRHPKLIYRQHPSSSHETTSAIPSSFPPPPYPQSSQP